jgi:LacI family transcriptional regulator
MIKPKYKDLSKLLKAAINEGKWQNRLPGVFRLAKEYDVDPATVSKALKLLETEGLITINGRRGTFISRRAPRTVHKVIGALGVSDKDGNPAPTQIAIKEYCKNYGYEIVAISQNDDLLKSNPQFWTKLPVDGLIFMNSTLTSNLISELRQNGMPFVSANKILNFPGVTWVDFDSETGLADMIRYLYKLGHRRIAFADVYVSNNNFTERLHKVYHETCSKLNCLDEKLFYISPSQEGLADKFLDLKTGASAIISLTYTVTESFKEAIEKRGLKIPGDISLATYKPEDHDNFFTISYFQNEKRSQMAAELLLEKIQHPGCEVKQITLENKLIPGKSTARIK